MFGGREEDPAHRKSVAIYALDARDHKITRSACDCFGTRVGHGLNCQKLRRSNSDAISCRQVQGKKTKGLERLKRHSRPTLWWFLMV